MRGESDAERDPETQSAFSSAKCRICLRESGRNILPLENDGPRTGQHPQQRIAPASTCLIPTFADYADAYRPRLRVTFTSSTAFTEIQRLSQKSFSRRSGNSTLTFSPLQSGQGHRGSLAGFTRPEGCAARSFFV
jgi:hypothetical protein